MDDIALRIKELIDDKGLTNGEFAKTIETNPSIISHIMSGRNKVSLQLVESIKRNFTNVNLDYLLTGRGNLYADITNVNNEMRVDEPSTSGFPASAFPMEGVRHAAIPGSAPGYEESKAQKEEKEEEPPASKVEEPAPYSTQRSPFQDEEVEQIIVLYRDGSFKVYKPRAL